MDDRVEPVEVDRDESDPLGIVIHGQWGPPVRPMIMAFIWGGKVRPTPELPYGKTAA